MFASVLTSATAFLALAGPAFGSAITTELLSRAAVTSPGACKGYKLGGLKTKGNTITANLNLIGKGCNVYGTDISSLQLLVEYQATGRVHVQIYDSAQQVYQVPESVLPRPSSSQANFKLNNQDLKFNHVANPFSFSITRQTTGEVLFDTSGWPLIFESQYIGLRTKLPDNPNLYGLGETTDPFRLNTTDYTRTLWSRDAYTVPTGSNLYGNHPVYFDHRPATGTHGVFLLNSNGMDVNISSNAGAAGTQYLEYNVIGGIFDFYFLSGPTPKAVAQQYSATVGLPVMQPYWGLGFHQCRYGMQDVYEVAGVVANYSAAGIPLETMWTDIDYMDERRVFTLDPDRFPLNKMQQLVDYLHSHQQHYIVMVDPAVWYGNYDGFNQGVAAGAFLLNSSGLPYQGVVWPGVTAFPDWFAAGTQGYWNEQFYNFFNPNGGLDIDALWIDMNEASNFCAFPCTNPDQYAITAGDPPIPPAVRLYSPYPIPGFPADFQPQCVSYVDFAVDASTYYGENILVTGNTGTLGNNVPNQSPLLSANTYPIWRASIQFPINSKIQYSYVRAESGGTYILETITRTVTTGGCGSHVATNDTITTAQGTPPSKMKRDVAPIVKAVRPPVANTAAGAMMGLPNRDLLNPPYNIHNTNGPLSGNTINVTIVHQNGLVEYDTHNMYGTMMSAASRVAMQNRRKGLRPMVITRSTFAGAGRQVGHWLGDNVADWFHYRISIAEMLEFAALYQVPMVGSDVCGYAGDPDEFLCARWAMLGAFSPFYRNHKTNGVPTQEFYKWPLVTAAAKKAIGARYQLLDYIYTALYNQTVTGTPLVNPMFFKYPTDKVAPTLDLQYFWGDAIMIAPVTADNATYVNFYMPNDLFYDFWTHAPIQGNGSMYNIGYVDFMSLPMYYQGGNIIPQRLNSANTTTMLRQQPFNIVIAPGADGTATGSLYIDEGTENNQPAITLASMSYQSGVFKMTGTFDYSTVNIGQITILGASGAASSAVNVATASGLKAPTYDSAAQSLTYTVDIPLNKAYSVKLH